MNPYKTGILSGIYYNIVASIDSNVNNLNIYNYARSYGWNGTTRLRMYLTIAGNVTVGSTNPSLPAMTISGFRDESQTAYHDVLDLINHGNILGAGGLPGMAGYSNSIAGSDGGPGGTAILTTNVLTLTNNGSIWSGGGGGGGGGGYYAASYCGGSGSGNCGSYACNGGGCSGCVISTGYGYCCATNKQASISWCGSTYPEINAYGGVGGTGYGFNNTSIAGAAASPGGSGGSGGTYYGVAGSDGVASTTLNGKGGRAGYCIDGYSLLTTPVVGSVLGGFIN